MYGFCLFFCQTGPPYSARFCSWSTMKKTSPSTSPAKSSNGSTRPATAKSSPRPRRSTTNSSASRRPARSTSTASPAPPPSTISPAPTGTASTTRSAASATSSRRTFTRAFSSSTSTPNSSRPSPVQPPWTSQPSHSPQTRWWRFYSPAHLVHRDNYRAWSRPTRSRAHTPRLIGGLFSFSFSRTLINKNGMAQFWVAAWSRGHRKARWEFSACHFIAHFFSGGGNWKGERRRLHCLRPVCIISRPQECVAGKAHWCFCVLRLLIERKFVGVKRMSLSAGVSVES